MHTKCGEGEGKISSTPPPLTGLLVREVPKVESATRLYPKPNEVVFVGEKLFTGDIILATDSNFLRVFSFPLLHGHSETAFTQPNSVVLTPEVARKYFSEPEKAMGQVLQICKEKASFPSSPYSLGASVTGGFLWCEFAN